MSSMLPLFRRIVLDTVWDKQQASLGLSVFVLFFLFRLPLRLFDKKTDHGL